MKKSYKIFAAALLLAFLILIIYVTNRKSANLAVQNSPDSVPKVLSEQSPEGQTDSAATLNGSLVSSGEAQKRPIAVMVENHPDARPQSGLAEADMVYETLAEGGITRFMAVYQTESASNIGPVRSARTYFAEIADEFGAIYAHVGGNSDALANIKSGVYKNIADADQFFNDDFFRRISARPMPHNVYTSTSELRELASAHGFADAANYQSWLFKDDAPSANPAEKINIDFSLPSFAVQWRYNPAGNNYARTMAGQLHKDKDTGKQITAKNIIVQYVETFPVKSDTPLAIGMTLTGSGKSVVFEDGKAIEGAWKKDNSGRTRYYSQDGAEIRFNRGQTWVELVPSDRSVSWK
ncbi:MAG: DUF3048 domain-containing protein [Patescibacteria group bacterium]|nr:DUF3048 domain-containing protein [Patescibacteria group bacterium]